MEVLTKMVDPDALEVTETLAQRVRRGVKVEKAESMEKEELVETEETVVVPLQGEQVE